MRRLLAAHLLALTLILLLAGSVLAHARLLKSEPAAGSTLTAAPKQIVLWFNEELDTRQSSIKVANAAGTAVDLGNTKVNLDDRKQMTVGLRSPLANGVYLVRWHAVTPDDNGVSEGEFRFTLNAPAQATSAPTQQPAASPTIAPVAPSPTPAPPTPVPSATPMPPTATPLPPAPTLAPTTAPAPPAEGAFDAATLLVGASLLIVAAGAFLLLRKRG